VLCRALFASDHLEYYRVHLGTPVAGVLKSVAPPTNAFLATLLLLRPYQQLSPHRQTARYQSRSISSHLLTKAQHKASTLKCLPCFCYHYHWKKNRLLPTNSDYWLHWIYSKITDTSLLTKIQPSSSSHHSSKSPYHDPQTKTLILWKSLHSTWCYANVSKRLKTLEILSITAARQQQPQSPLTESTPTASGTNHGLVSPRGGTSCHCTFSAIATPRVDTVNYKR